MLNTSSPISGVVSCSMLPNLQRGDFIIVQGAPVNAYHINMTRQELDSLDAPATETIGGRSMVINGSIFPYCINNRTNPICAEFISNPTQLVETKGAFTYNYQRCDLSFSSGQLESEPCLKSITFHGTDYMSNFSNDIIVYQPPKGDYYALVGDIVHRALFVIDVDGSTYYLTRGDNNPIIDIQAYDYTDNLENHPVPQADLRGKVISRVPYLGYFKLFIVGSFTADPQCDTQLTFQHV